MDVMICAGAIAKFIWFGYSKGRLSDWAYAQRFEKETLGRTERWAEFGVCCAKRIGRDLAASCKIDVHFAANRLSGLTSGICIRTGQGGGFPAAERIRPNSAGGYRRPVQKQNAGCGEIARSTTGKLGVKESDCAEVESGRHHLS